MFEGTRIFSFILLTSDTPDSFWRERPATDTDPACSPWDRDASPFSKGPSPKGHVELVGGRSTENTDGEGLRGSDIQLADQPPRPSVLPTPVLWPVGGQ